MSSSNTIIGEILTDNNLTVRDNCLLSSEDIENVQLTYKIDRLYAKIKELEDNALSFKCRRDILIDSIKDGTATEAEKKIYKDAGVIRQESNLAIQAIKRTIDELTDSQLLMTSVMLNKFIQSSEGSSNFFNGRTRTRVKYSTTKLYRAMYELGGRKLAFAVEGFGYDLLVNQRQLYNKNIINKETLDGFHLQEFDDACSKDKCRITKADFYALVRKFE
jgi:hypothetical protein